MHTRANDRVAWFNGEFMPEREVRIPFRDSSWVHGDGCFDMTRSFDLARQEGLAVREADIDLYDAYNADEVFLTSTSLCICPVTRVNGVEVGPKGPGGQQVWGPATQRLADAYRRFVDYDFVGQYLKHYVEGMEARAF